MAISRKIQVLFWRRSSWVNLGWIEFGPWRFLQKFANSFLQVFPKDFVSTTILSSWRESEKPVNSIQGAALKKFAYLFLTKILICHGFSYKNHGWYLYYFSDLARTTIFLKNTFQYIWKMHVLEFFLEIFADPSFKFKCPHLDNIQSSDLCSSSILLFIFFQFDISLWGISCYQTLHSLCYCLHFLGLQSRVLTQTFLGLIFFFFWEGSIVEGLLKLKPLPTFLYTISVIHSTTLLKVSNIGTMYLIGGILLETYHE